MKNLKIIGGILITLSIFFSVLNRTSINQNSNNNSPNVSSSINDTNNNKNGGSNNVGGGADINNSKVSVNDFVKGQIDNYKKESNIKQNTTKVVIDSGDGSNMLSYFYNISYNAYSKDGGGETPETYSASGYTPYNYVLGSENDDIKGNNQNGYVAAGDFLDTLKIHMPYNYQGTSTIHWASYAIKHEVELAQSMGLVKYFTIKATGILTCPSINIYANINGKDEMIGGFGVYDFYNTNGLWAISLMTITSAILLGAAVTSTSMGIGFAAYKFRNMIKDAFSVGRLLGGMGDIGDFDVDATNISSYLNDDSPVQNLDNSATNIIDNSATNINNATNHNTDVHLQQSDRGTDTHSAVDNPQPVSHSLDSSYEDVASNIDNNDSVTVASNSSSSVIDINEESATNFHQENVNEATPDLVETAHQNIEDFLSHNVDDIDFSSNELQTQIFWSDYASSEAFLNTGSETAYNIGTQITGSESLRKIMEFNSIVRRSFRIYGESADDIGFISWLKSSDLMNNKGFSEIYTNYEESVNFQRDVKTGKWNQKYRDMTKDSKIQLEKYNNSIKNFETSLALYRDALSQNQDTIELLQGLKDSYNQLLIAWNDINETKNSFDLYIKSVINDKAWLDSFVAGVSPETENEWLLTNLRTNETYPTYSDLRIRDNVTSQRDSAEAYEIPGISIATNDNSVLLNKLDYFITNAQYRYQLSIADEDKTIDNLNFNNRMLDGQESFTHKNYEGVLEKHRTRITQFATDNEDATSKFSSDEISQELEYMNQQLLNSKDRQSILEGFDRYNDLKEQRALISESITTQHDIYLRYIREYNTLFDVDGESLSDTGRLMDIKDCRDRILEAQIQRDNYIKQEQAIMKSMGRLTNEINSKIFEFQRLNLHSEYFK